MRKIMLMISLLIGIISVHAQSEPNNKWNISGGIKAEANYSNFVHSGIPDTESKMKPGVSLGAFARYGVLKTLYIQGEVLYHYKHSDLNRNGINGKYQYWGTEIPIYATFHWDLPNGNFFYVGAGPFAEFGFASTLKRNGSKLDLYVKDDDTGLSMMQTYNTGFAFIIGYEFKCGIQVNASYKLSISNLQDENSSIVKLRPQTLAVGIGYCIWK